MTFDEKIQSMFEWNGWDSIDAPLLSSLIVMAFLLIIGIIIGIKAHIGYKKKTYLSRPKGILFLAEEFYNLCDRFVADSMGETRRIWGGYFWTLFSYLFLSFIISIFGLPSIIDWLAAPLCLALIMFTLIQVTAIRYTHFYYLHRFIEPIAVFLPVNLITMWSPIISTTMRMFGNCLAGTVIMGLIQWALESASATLFGAFGVSGGWTGLVLTPIPIGILNAYFSIFSGFVQTLVFASLTALWIAQEMPEEEEKVVSTPLSLDDPEDNKIQEVQFS